MLNNNKVSFTDGTEHIISNGCGGAFTPYGNNVLLRNTALVISLLQQIMTGNINSNVLISCPNCFKSLEESIKINPIIDFDFSDGSCDVCGNI